MNMTVDVKSIDDWTKVVCYSNLEYGARRLLSGEGDSNQGSTIHSSIICWLGPIIDCAVLLFCLREPECISIKQYFNETNIK